MRKKLKSFADLAQHRLDRLPRTEAEVAQHPEPRDGSTFEDEVLRVSALTPEQIRQAH